jgi:aminopeptidase N
MEPLVLARVAGQLADLDRLYDGLPAQARYRAFAGKLLSPLLAPIGWDAKKAEGANVPVLRQALLAAMGEFDDPAVVAEARRRFETYARARHALAPDVRQSMLAIVSEDADPATWNRLREFARETKSSIENRQFYEYLARARDPALASRNLKLSLDDEVPVTTRPAMLRIVGEEHPDLALAFLSAHFDAYNRALEPDSRAQFAPEIVQNASDPRTIAALKAFAREHIPADARGDEVRAEAAINWNAKLRRDCLPEFDAWIARHS